MIILCNKLFTSLLTSFLVVVSTKGQYLVRQIAVC